MRPPIQDTPHTISDLFVDANWFSNVLEDKDRCIHQTDSLDYINKVKVKHETAIPYGTYQVVMSYSNKFKQYLPELLDVPGYGGIRIHTGNDVEDTSGCPLPGIKDKNRVVKSKVTATKLISLISKRIKKEKVFISIVPSEVITPTSAS